MTYTPEDLARAKRYRDVSPPRLLGLPQGVYFEWELAGPAGARFALYREPHHTDADIRTAAAYLLAERDVVQLVILPAPVAAAWPLSGP